MLEVKIDSNEKTIRFNGSLGELIGNLVYFMDVLRSGMRTEDKAFFDHFLKNVFIDCVLASDAEEVKKILDKYQLR